jgi:hypothetical protein
MIVVENGKKWKIYFSEIGGGLFFEAGLTSFLRKRAENTSAAHESCGLAEQNS